MSNLNLNKQVISKPNFKIGSGSMKLLACLVLSIFCFDSLYSSSANRINEDLLKHAKSYTTVDENLNALHDYLVQVAENESQKAEVFFYWISQNIDYDIEGLLSKAYLTDEENILKSRKGVCEDFANLFKDLCDLSAIECHKITGYAKGYGFDPNKEGEIDHAWNIVKVDGTYKFVDATWGSGYTEDLGNGLKYFREIEMDYVLVNSNYFRLRHLPGDPKWQLLEKPISFSRFISNETYETMYVDHSFTFNFLDSISKHNDLDLQERRISEWKNICDFYPSSSNYYEAGLACLNVGIDLSGIEVFDVAAIHRAKKILKLGQVYLNKGKKKSPENLKEFEAELLRARRGIVYCNFRIVNKK